MGKGESCRDRCCRVQKSSGDNLKAGPPDVAGRPRGQESRRYKLGGGGAATAK